MCDRDSDFFHDLILMKNSEVNGIVQFIFRISGVSSSSATLRVWLSLAPTQDAVAVSAFLFFTIILKVLIILFQTLESGSIFS